MKNKSFEKLFFSKTREFLDEYLSIPGDSEPPFR